MTDTLPTLPRFVIVHEVPDGTQRFAYHRDLLEHAKSTPRYGADAPANGWTWTGLEGDVVWSGDWLVSAVELSGVQVTRPGAMQDDGWIRRSEPHWGDYAVPPERRWDEHDDLPERPDPAALDHYREHDAAHACWECRAFSAHYQRHRVQGPPVVEVETFDSFTLLPGGLPPVIDRDQLRHPPGQVRSRGLFAGDEVKQEEMRWLVDDTAQLAIYGESARHLLPGRLTGLRSAVGVVLAGHPSIGSFHDWHESSSPPSGGRGFSVTVQVPWEHPRTKTVYETRGPRGRKKYPYQVPDYAIEQRMTIAVPQAVHAATLAEALAGWDDAVEEEVRRFFPYGEQVMACDSCRGRGWKSRTL